MTKHQPSMNTIDIFKDYINKNNIDIKDLSFINNDDFRSIRKLLIEQINIRLENRSNYFISFEGIDATGKGTISRYLDSFLKELKFNSERINIPNYNLESGKIISNALSTNISEEDLYKRRYEFINHFATNRKEVNHNYSNKIQDWDWDKPKIFIFDRWINSSIAFSISKTILHINKDINDLGIEDNNLIGSIIDYNYNLEIDIFKNDIIDLEFIITSKLDLIEKRIQDRNKLQNSNKDNDIIKDDQHEKNIKLLSTTQKVFVSLETGKLGNFYYLNRAAVNTYKIKNNKEIDNAILSCLEKILK